MKFEPIDPGFGLQLWILFVFVTLILWIYSFVDVLRSSFKGNDKIVWLLAVIFVPLLGSVSYILIGRKQKMKMQ